MRDADRLAVGDRVRAVGGAAWMKLVGVIEGPGDFDGTWTVRTGTGSLYDVAAERLEKIEGEVP